MRWLDGITDTIDVSGEMLSELFPNRGSQGEVDVLGRENHLNY